MKKQTDSSSRFENEIVTCLMTTQDKNCIVQPLLSNVIRFRMMRIYIA